jgi:hypothetical protein
MYDPTGGYPDLVTIRDRIGVPATVLSDAHLDEIAEAEQVRVNANYDWSGGNLPAPMLAVFLRAVSRHAAALGVPLGILAADAEYGTVRLSARDAQITAEGGMYRKRTFA